MTEKRVASIPKDGLDSKSKASKDELKFIKFKQDLVSTIQALSKSALNTVYHSQNTQIINENGILTENMNKLLYLQISNYVEEINQLKKKLKLFEKTKSSTEDITKLSLQVTKLQTEIAYYKNMIITLEKEISERSKKEEKFKIENDSLKKHIMYLTISHGISQGQVPNNALANPTVTETKKPAVKPIKDLKPFREKSQDNPKPRSYFNRTFQDINEDKEKVKKTAASKMRTTAVSKNLNVNSESMELKISEDEHIAEEETRENGIKTTSACLTPKPLVNSKLSSIKKLNQKMHTKTYCNIKELTIEDSECEAKKLVTSSVKNTIKKDLKSLKTFNILQKSFDNSFNNQGLKDTTLNTPIFNQSINKKPKPDNKKIILNSTTNKNGGTNPFKNEKNSRVPNQVNIVSPINVAKGHSGVNVSQAFSLYNVLEEKSLEAPNIDKNAGNNDESIALSMVESELETLQGMEQDLIELQEKYVSFYEEKTSLVKHNYEQTFIVEYQEKRYQPCT